MKKCKELLSLIDEIRNRMTELLVEKGSLLDPEVIKISQELDKALNRYYISMEEVGN
ncbi:Spo0E family sporulation regulatory protein-aspartic acid phosphatase [Clostridium bovifaecis]|uniref:Spo0E family sporulation regulatory protein-aspartic acid phosphatase n=1 Tax=Clostridium bovifaecis TaxID=2184719 RepID=A0A6I6EPZ0_9CLOT|nr:Spo0E family sporulation regulatory protein-aspartic acid phosphatase [Clostridium bovifaecis]